MTSLEIIHCLKQGYKHCPGCGHLVKNFQEHWAPVNIDKGYTDTELTSHIKRYGGVQSDANLKVYQGSRRMAVKMVLKKLTPA